jgi:hypothetical protein
MIPETPNLGNWAILIAPVSFILISAFCVWFASIMNRNTN